MLLQFDRSRGLDPVRSLPLTIEIDIDFEIDDYPELHCRGPVGKMDPAYRFHPVTIEIEIGTGLRNLTRSRSFGGRQE